MTTKSDEERIAEIIGLSKDNQGNWYMHQGSPLETVKGGPHVVRQLQAMLAEARMDEFNLARNSHSLELGYARKRSTELDVLSSQTKQDEA